MTPYETFGSAPEFDGAVDWLNCGEALRLNELRGKIVLVDFWSYCCINCMHVLADLAYVAEKYSNQLVIVGIHSGKFENERNTSNLLRAIERYEIRYPVANDAEYRIWKAYGAQAWPTLCLIDPKGEVAAAYSGEGHREELDRTIGLLVEHHRSSKTLDETPLVLIRQPRGRPKDALLFPGKVLVDGPRGRLFISDSNHDRILICRLDGTVEDIAGCGAAGLEDGPFEAARFFRPQGTALRDNVLYVADSANHAVRALDLTMRHVTTFGGTGQQGNFRTMTGGPETSLSSPWDVALVDNMLYVAMAGTHQIWRAAVETRNFRLFAGSGVENLMDGPGPSAQLAQPSGLTVGDHFLYFADSAVSAVRRANLRASGEVETLIGAGLFEFGDRAGPARTARLQHPMGVCWHDGKVFIADTYNHRIKVLYPADRTVVNLLGAGRAGCGEGRDGALYEPAGISIYGGKVYIADTNNHRVAVAGLDDRELETLPLRFPNQRGAASGA